jgi:hypothetical protein
MASGDGSHAEGSGTIALGDYSHAEGVGTIALGAGQHVQGTYNVTGDTQLAIIGNGTYFNRSNLVEYYTTGITVSDNIRLTQQPSSLTDFDDLTLVTKLYVDTLISGVTSTAFQKLNYTGSINGSNTEFIVTGDNLVVNSEQVFLNGLLQESGGADYTISGNTITFVVAPQSGNKVTIYGDTQS